MKKTAKKQFHIRWTWIIIGALVITQAVTAYSLVQLRDQYDLDGLYGFVNSTEQKIYRYPVISVNENKVYFTEFKLNVPLDTVSRNVRYNGMQTNNLVLSLPSAIGRQTSADSPTCDAMVRISDTNELRQDETYVGEVAITGSSLKYIFKHNSCLIYDSGSIDQLVNIAKSLSSY